MSSKKYNWIFYLIATTIVTTVGVQLYWNFKNYQENKQRVTNDIQLSFDNAIEEYYSSMAKSSFLTIVDTNQGLKDKKNLENSKIGTFLKKIKNTTKDSAVANVKINNISITTDENLSKESVDSILNSTKKFVSKFNKNKTVISPKNKDSAKIYTQLTDKNNGYTIHSDGSKTAIKYYKGKKAADSLRFVSSIKPIFISFVNQNVDYQQLDSLIHKQLQKKGLTISTNFYHLKNDTIFHQKINDKNIINPLNTVAKSTFIKDNERFELQYKNPSFEALKRSSFGLFLSFILALAVVASLFYLLKIINQQKDLANIKNDLISNITHEFKTPIATVSTAIEAIENFNVLEDKEKTKKYLSMSSIQLKKLHQMVEKLLETATLDSEQLMLKKEHVDIVEIIERLVTKHQLLSTNEFIFSTNLQPIYAKVDVFHFENCISNLIDNAVKYGGNTIQININSILNAVEISIADDGNGIEKNQQEKIFDKFYRVSKGNTHNVKGFGIGLYYCKKIIEKHEGNIQLTSSKNNTTFKVTLPNG